MKHKSSFIYSKLFHFLLFFVLSVTMLGFPVILEGEDSVSKRKPVVLKSKVEEVTLFTDRALVTRTGNITLPAGNHRLLFRNLPEKMIPQSIHLSGIGQFTLNDMKFQKVPVPAIPRNQLKSLLTKKENLSDRINELEDRLNQIEKDKDFLDKIVKKSTHTSKESKDSEMDPEKWIKLAQFYRTQNDTLAKEMRHAKKELKKLQEELKKVISKLRETGHLNRKWERQVVADIANLKEQPLVLQLSYLVMGPRWQPVYDLRVQTETRKMTVLYNALVKQSTAEDWKHVRMKLSTARPHLGSKHADLTAWRIYFVQRKAKSFKGFVDGASGAENMFYVDGVNTNKPEPAPQMFATEENRKKTDSQLLQVPKAGKFARSRPRVDIPERIMAQKQSSVQGRISSVEFALEGSHTILSDNQDHKVRLMKRDFPTHFRYSTAPKVTPYAFLKVEITNDSDYPFFPGKANIFLDEGFTTTSELEYASPGENFWVFLGVDEGIGVDYKFIKKLKGEKGVLSKKKTIVYSSDISIKNNKKTTVELVIWDQIPVSNHKDIKVELISPKFKENTPNLKMNERKIIEWLFHLEPGQDIKIPFSFSVEYPRDKYINLD